MIKAEDPEDRLFKKIVELFHDEDILELKSLSDAQNLHFDGVTILLSQRQVLKNKTQVYLTPLEFETLSYLARQPGRVFYKSANIPALVSR